jgi:hypothetical protein
MDFTSARRLGEDDAPRLIDIAQEVPLGGTGDPEKLQIPDPWCYRDSPELPARRVASDWDEYPHFHPYDNPIYPIGDNKPKPNVLTRIDGHAGEVYEDLPPGEAGEEIWADYQAGLFQALEEAEVALVPTVYIAYGPSPDFNGEFTYIFSNYVVDLARYEPRSMPQEQIQDDLFAPELFLQRVCIPRGLSRWQKRRRRRAKLAY